MKRTFLPLLAAGLLALTSCGDANKTADTATDSNMANTPAAGADTAATSGAIAGDSSAMPSNSTAIGDANGPTSPHKDDNEFMMTAAHSDQNEIQQNKMALDRHGQGNGQ